MRITTSSRATATTTSPRSTRPTPTTAVVHLKARFSPFVNSFFAESDQPYMVAPAHVLAQYPNINQIPFNNAPSVSDGPFKFVEWARGDHVTLARNDGFFIGKPGLEQSVIRIVPDEQTRGKPFAHARRSTICSRRPFKLHHRSNALRHQRSCGSTSTAMSTSAQPCARPFLKDPRVRLAIALRRRQKSARSDRDLRHADGRDRGYSQLDVGLQLEHPPDPSDVRRRAISAAKAGWKPGPTASCARTGNAVAGSGNEQLQRYAPAREPAGSRQCSAPSGSMSQIKYYPGDVLFAPAGMGGILQLGRFDLSDSGWYCRHRSRRQHAVHVRKLSAQRLQLLALLQSRRCRPRSASR